MSDNENFIVPIIKDREQRRKIIEFLVSFEGENRSVPFWRERLELWWEKNPFYSEDIPRGWLIVLNGVVVGFFGVIVTQYRLGTKQYKALNATTWRVAKTYRNLSISLFSKFYSLRNQYILFNTSPTDTVAKILEAFRFQKKGPLHRYVFPIKQFPQINFFKLIIHWKRKLYKLFMPKGNCKVIKETDNFAVDQTTEGSNKLTRDRSFNFIDWYCNGSDIFKKVIIGYFSDDNQLTSYMIIARQGKRRLNVIDYFTTDSTGHEVLSMLNYACEHPEQIIGKKYDHLIFSDFTDSDVLADVSLLRFIRQKRHIRHYYLLPPELKGAEIHHTMAEGDCGL